MTLLTTHSSLFFHVACTLRVTAVVINPSIITDARVWRCSISHTLGSGCWRRGGAVVSGVGMLGGRHGAVCEVFPDHQAESQPYQFVRLRTLAKAIKVDHLSTQEVQTHRSRSSLTPIPAPTKKNNLTSSYPNHTCSSMAACRIAVIM